MAGAGSAIQRVVAVAAVQRVAAGAAVQRVVAVVAEQQVVAVSADQAVVAIAAMERIVAGATKDRVVVDGAGHVANCANNQHPGAVRRPAIGEVRAGQAAGRHAVQLQHGLPVGRRARGIHLQQRVAAAVGDNPHVALDERVGGVEVAGDVVGQDIAGVDHVAAGAGLEAGDLVGRQARLPDQPERVLPVPAGQRAGAARPARNGLEQVVAVAAVQAVVALRIDQRIVAGAAQKRVVARSAQQRIVAVAAVDRIVAVAAVDRVVAVQAEQHIVAGRADDGVVAGIAGKGFAGGSVRREGRVEVRRSETAHQRVLQPQHGDRRGAAAGAVMVHLHQHVVVVLHQLDEAVGERVAPVRQAAQVGQDVGEVDDVAARAGGEVGDDIGRAREDRIEPVGIHPVAAGQQVAAAAGAGDIEEQVVAGAAADGAVAVWHVDRVVAVAARHQGAVAGVTVIAGDRDLVGTGAAIDGLGAVVAARHDRVVVVAAADAVVAIKGVFVQRIRAGAAVQRGGIVRRVGDRVVAGAGGDSIAIVVSVCRNRVVADAAVDRAAGSIVIIRHDRIVAVAAFNRIAVVVAIAIAIDAVIASAAVIRTAGAIVISRVDGIVAVATVYCVVVVIPPGVDRVVASTASDQAAGGAIIA